MLDNMTAADASEIIKSIALFLGVLATFITSVVSAFLSLRNGRAIAVNSERIKEVHESTNGAIAALIEVNSKAARSEGHEAGRKEEESREADRRKELAKRNGWV